MASIKKYRVVGPKGFLFAGKVKPEGETFQADSASAHIGTGLHFKQIEEVAESAAPEVPAEDPEKKPEDPPETKKPEGEKSKADAPKK